MPRCKKCGALIMSGTQCDVCAREWELDADPDRPTPPDYIKCEHCDGRSWVRQNGDKEDCEVCDGFGKVRVDRELAADGGLEDTNIIVAEDGGEIIDE